jgi:hypothetical protein
MGIMSGKDRGRGDGGGESGKGGRGGIPQVGKTETGVGVRLIREVGFVR